MERTEVLELMGTLKLYGMRSAYDEIMGVAIKRQHEPPKIVGDLLQAEISEKQARSIKYQLARLLRAPKSPRCAPTAPCLTKLRLGFSIVYDHTHLMRPFCRMVADVIRSEESGFPAPTPSSPTPWWLPVPAPR